MKAARALCLAGPTAAGKTAVALALAERMPVEVVSVDSALVYRGMDIGTAKPSVDERRRVPHHLIDIRDPADRYSAAEFAADARRRVDEIRGRGRVPLLVGGTMLYFKALREGLDVLPAADEAVRAELDARAQREGWPALHAELARVDPETAARLAPHDAQRIQRALEVWQVSGRPLAAWHRARPLVADDLDTWPMLSLEPTSRAWLHRRIEQRFHTMLQQGLVDEVRGLRARGDLHAGLPSMRAVGYRQAWEALESGALGELAARGIAATRQLAKRQLTWLRSSTRQVLACDDDHAVERAVEVLTDWARTRLEPPPC